jgi:hypothetical protein
MIGDEVKLRGLIDFPYRIHAEDKAASGLYSTPRSKMR